MNGSIDTGNDRSDRTESPRAALALCVLMALALLAGAPNVDAGERPAEVAEPAPEAAGAAAEAAEVPPEVVETPDAILLNFRDAPLSAVLEHLSEVGGLVIVVEAAVDGRVTVMSRQPLNTQEAVDLLNTVLVEQGFAAVRKGRLLKIVTLEDAKKMNVPVRSGTDPEKIEPNDEIITQVIPLKFADAVQLREDLATLIPAYADLSANASSNALILTDTGANVRRIVEIVKALDTHMATVAEVRVFQLIYADASDAADLINRVFEQEQRSSTQQRRAAFGMGRFFRGPGGAGDRAEEGVSRAPEVTAAADERTNTVVVSGPADTLEVVAHVIEQLDANPAEEESVLVYSLKNAQAANVAELLNNLFREAEQTAGGRRTTGARGAQTQGRAARFAAFMRGTTAAAAAEGVGSLSGQVYCVADEDTNTLLVLTAPSNFERLRSIINDLDRPIPQVLIKVLIAEVTWSDSLDLGAEFSILDVEPDGDENSLFTDFGVAGESDGIIYRMVGGEVSATLRALEKLGKLDILSRPHILTSDNQTATITVGQEVPFIRNTRTTETGQTINTIRYEDIGIILEVTPHINPDGLVIMDVAPEISTTTAETVPISETVDAAVFAKRSAQTRIAIRDGQTIVIGGLMQDSNTESIRKVPIMGDIPLLGALFRRTVKNKEKTELLIFLTPHVAREANELQGMSDEELTGVRQMKDAVAPGVFDEHMQGLRLGGDAAASE